MLTTDLLKRIFDGDRQAAFTLHQTMRAGIIGALQKRGATADAAQEVYAETCVILLEQYYHHKLQEHSNLGGFMMQTAKNLLHLEHRQAARFGYALPEGYEDTEPEDILDALDRLALDEDLLRIARCLQSLSDADRDLLEQHAVEGVPLAAIARQQKEKETTVRQRFNRALAKLRVGYAC